MSGLILVVGALVVAVGGYEMFVGSGDILSERGWSAYISGAVLVAGGIVTMALGLAVRAVEHLRGAILGQTVMPHAAAARIEPGSEVTIAPPPTPVDVERDPSFAVASTGTMLASPEIDDATFEEPRSDEREKARIEAPFAVAAHDREPVPAAASEPEPMREDWLDHSLAQLEREMAVPREATANEPAPPPEPAWADPARSAAPESAPANIAPLEEPETSYAEPAAREPVPPAVMEDEPAPSEPATQVHDFDEPAPYEPAPHEPAFTESTTDEPAKEQATVSARENPAPSSSAVIGRYESEGTSYVMYADGSIDAQSEAGVYRFASMAELKTFIES